MPTATFRTRPRVIPPQGQDFARGPSESESPEQWRGLLLCVAPFMGIQGVRVQDLSGAWRHGTLSGAGWGVTTHGIALVHDATSDQTSFGDGSFLPTTAMTVLLDYEKRDATLRESGAFGLEPNPPGEGSRCGAHLPYTDGTVYWDFGGVVAGTTRLSVGGLTVTGRHLWAFTTGPRGMELWQDGLQVATNAATPTRTTTLNAFVLGQHGGAVAGSDLANYYEFRVYNYQWPLALLRDLVSPDLRYDLYRPRRRPFRVAWDEATLVPDAILAATNLTGAVTDIDEDADSPDANWLTATSATAVTDLRVGFTTPPDDPLGGQNFRLWVRKTAGTPNPTLTAELRQSTALIATLFTDTAITDTTGQGLEGVWHASQLISPVDGSDVELRLVSTPGQSAGTPGATPVYTATGQGAVSQNATITNTLNPVKPSTLNAGDLMILQVLARNDNNNGAGPATITGWTAFPGNPYGGANNARQSLYWRIAGAGEASQTVALACTGGTTNDLALARIYRFTAANGFAATPIEGITTNAGTASPLAAPASVTPSGLNRRAVCFGAIASSDAAVGSLTGETAGNWIEAVSSASSLGGHGTINVQTADASAGTAIQGGSVAFTLSTSAHWNTVGCCLVPTTTGATDVNTVEIGAIEWNASYRTPLVVVSGPRVGSHLLMGLGR